LKNKPKGNFKTLANAFHLTDRNQESVFKKTKITFHRLHGKLMCFLSSQIPTLLSSTQKKHFVLNMWFGFHWN